MENGMIILGEIGRRDVADSLRALADRSAIPSDAELAGFDELMKQKHLPTELGSKP